MKNQFKDKSLIFNYDTYYDHIYLVIHIYHQIDLKESLHFII